MFDTHTLHSDSLSCWQSLHYESYWLSQSLRRNLSVRRAYTAYAHCFPSCCYGACSEDVRPHLGRVGIRKWTTWIHLDRAVQSSWGDGLEWAGWSDGEVLERVGSWLPTSTTPWWGRWLRGGEWRFPVQMNQMKTLKKVPLWMTYVSCWCHK